MPPRHPVTPSPRQSSPAFLGTFQTPSYPRLGFETYRENSELTNLLISP